jgi:hypothetical protein
MAQSPVSLRIIRATGEALTTGVELHTIEQVEVPITDPAKTVAGCFKYRSQIGLDVAIEALKDCLRSRRGNPYNSKAESFMETVRSSPSNPRTTAPRSPLFQDS